MKLRIYNLLVALDIFVFAMVTFGESKRNESMSAAAYSTELSGKLAGRIFRPMIDWLMSFREADHCRIQYEFENPKESP